MDILEQSISGDLKPNASSQGELLLLRRQLQEHFSTIRASVVGNCINVALVVAAFWSSWSVAFFAILLLPFFGIMGSRVQDAAKFPKAKLDAVSLTRLKRKTEIKAGLLGTWWGGLMLTLISNGATPAQQILCACFGAGMMAGGAMNFRSLEKAGIYYLTGSGLLTCIGLATVGSAAGYAAVGMGICYFATLLVSVKSISKNIATRHEREFELRESAATINMLLADFSEQGSDLLIEFAHDGRLVNPTEQLAAAAKRPVETLAGQSLFDMLDEGSERDALVDHLTNSRIIRNHSVSLVIGSEKIWWSISARPVREQDGLYRGIVTDITAQRQAEEKVSYMAHFDALTALPNRFQFNQRLEQMLREAPDNVGLMYLDLDQFKVINDTLGHSFGDMLLKGVAKRLNQSIGSDEIVARLGGDEFAVLFKTNELRTIKAVGEQIIKSLENPFRLDDHDVIVGTSIGIAVSPDHGKDASTLLRNADLALYDAKDQGRNRQAVFEAGMDEAAQLRRSLELDLRGALGKSELCLHYQPLVRIDDGETLGYEALIRWEHPERGVVMPDSFIPIAEESGMIIPIGEWVIRQAMDDLTQWPEGKTVSINLSPAQMRSPSLITTMIQGLSKTGVDPKRICIEITENVLMQDSEANLATLHKLHEIGVQIALDDFGTGYSSLNYLRSFPFDKIKIDRCFVNEIDTREDCQAIVRSVVDLATSLGMTTTAEGVEREDQVAQLRSEGCGEVQGYLFSKAVPQSELTDLRKPFESHAERLVRLEERRVEKSGAAELLPQKLRRGVMK